MKRSVLPVTVSLCMIRQRLEKGVITEGVLENYYVTFMVGIFRSVRFGASNAHGKANMIRFNFFAEQRDFLVMKTVCIKLICQKWAVKLMHYLS
jgi:hypothetical protein